MAEINIDVAKQSTSDEINSKLGATNDSVTLGTIHAKLNKMQTDKADKEDIHDLASQMKSFNLEMRDILEGNPTAFGAGALGDVTYSDNFIYPSKDYFGRYILQFTNFTLPEGVTMTPPEECNGLYIYCTGTCTINGTIDMKGKRLTLDGDNGISNFITIGGVSYPLAKGGDTVKGGNGGKGGKAVYYATSGSHSYSYSWYTGGVPVNTTAGNTNGGGSSTYGKKGVADTPMTASLGQDSSHIKTGEVGHNGEASPFMPATGAVVICANKLIINGQVDCSAVEGVACENIGTDATNVTAESTGKFSWYFTANCGVGGDGAHAPSGGGCITIVANTFNNNGKLLTNGRSLVCTSSAVGQNVSDTGVSYPEDTYYYGIFATGGTAGTGGTFISQAGEIKVYVIGGEA